MQGLKSPPPSDGACSLFPTPYSLQLSHRERISACEEFPLMPVRINRRLFACFIERFHLGLCQAPTLGSQILAQLFLIARAQND